MRSAGPSTASRAGGHDVAHLHHKLAERYARARRHRAAALWMLMAQRGEVSHLLLGEIEHDPVLYVGDSANRDGDFLAPPQMPFLEQHMGHPVVVPIDDDPLHLPDLPI